MAVIQLGNIKMSAAQDKLPSDLDLLISMDSSRLTEVVSGDCGGKSLLEYINTHDGCLGTKGKGLKKFPFVVKVLSNPIPGLVQVNAYPNQDSLWYMLEAREGAAIGYGFKEGVTKEQITDGIVNNTLAQDLNVIPVKAGEVLKVEAGTVFALCNGLTILDIQNELINDAPTKEIVELLKIEPVTHDHHMGEWLADGEAKYGCLGKVASFDADLYDLHGRLDMDADSESFKVLVFTEGTAVIESGDEILHAQQYSTFFVGADTKPFHITGNCQFVMIRMA